MRRNAALLMSNYDENDQPQPKRKGKATNESTYSGKAKSGVSKLHMTLKNIKPLTEAQRQMMVGFDSGVNLVCVGSAGTGKSYFACYLALKKLLDGEISQIKIVRSAVPSREIGFLPGDLNTKMEVYELPYRDIINELMQSGTAWEVMKKSGVVEFSSSSFLRGLTFKNCVIIFDEFQNENADTTRTLMTRVGDNAQLVLCGDTKQKDLTPRESGFDYTMKLVYKMPKWFDVVNFGIQDIVRSDFVKAVILADEEIS